MFKNLFFKKVLRTRILRSRINKKEFIMTTPMTETIGFAVIIFAMIFSGFFVFWFFETPIRNHPNLFLIISMGVYIFCAYRILKKEPKKDHNEKAFMDLLEYTDFLEEAGVSEEILSIMRIPVNLSLAETFDFQRENRKCSPTLPHKFFFLMRRITEKINNKIFYEI